MAEHKVHKALTKKETKKEKAATELHRLERREEAVRARGAAVRAVTATVLSREGMAEG